MTSSNPSTTRHPHHDALFGYADGELPADFVPEVEGHLAGCADCRALIAEYRELPTLRAAESEGAKAAVWSAIREELHAHSDAAEEVVQAAPAPPLRFPAPVAPQRRWVTPAALAASVLLALGLAQQVRKNIELTEASQRVRTDVPSFLVETPPPTVDRTRSIPPPIEVKSGADGFLLLVPVFDAKAPFSGELQGGAKTYPFPNAKPDSAVLNLQFPNIPAGVYRLRVIDAANVAVHDRELRIISPEP